MRRMRKSGIIRLSVRWRQMRLTTRAAVLAAAVTGGLLLPSTGSSALELDPILYVSHTAVAGAPDLSCATAAYQNVQTAVDATPAGSTVYLCGRTPFAGPVVIEKNLTLTGDEGATVKTNDNPAAPAADQIPPKYWSGQFAGLLPPNAVIAVLGNVNVTIVGVTVTGQFINSTCPSVLDDDYGIIALGSSPQGADLELSSDTLDSGGSSNLPDCPALGDGAVIGRHLWPTTGGVLQVVNFVAHATISDTTITGYHDKGMDVGAPGTTVDVQASVINGGGPSATFSPVGIQITRGATGEVAGNLIEGNEYTGATADDEAAGVVLFGGCTDTPLGGPLDTNVEIDGNHFLNNDIGISVFEGNDTSGCESSTTTPTDEQISGNVIAKNDGVTDTALYTDQYGNNYAGYQAGIADQGSDGDTISGNLIQSSDGAFGPQVSPPGAFLAPIDIQSFTPVDPHVLGNLYNGQPTNPPYPGEPGAP
jgi:hypothetical protein